MKVMLKIFAVLLVTSVASIVSAQKVASGAVLKVSFQASPAIKAINVGTTASSGKVKWLALELNYAFDSSKSAWKDGLMIKYEVLFPAYYEASKKNVLALASGTVKYWSVSTSGNHSAVAYIPPVVFKRYGRSGFKFKKGNIKKNFYARAIIMSKSQKVLGVAYYYPRGASGRTVAKKFAAAGKSLGVLKLEDLIFNRSQTPWANLMWDKYDLLELEAK